MRRATCLALLAVGALTIACSDEPAAAAPTASTADQRVVVRGDLKMQVLLTGEVVAEDAELLVAPNVNIWPLQIRWLLEDGTAVQAGDRVAEFDNSQLVSRLDEMRVAVIEAENRLQTIQAEGAAAVEEASLEVDRCRAQRAKAEIDAMVPEGLLAAREMGKRRLELSRAVLELEEAEQKLDNARRIAETEREIQRIAFSEARADVARATEGIERLTLRASRSGILILGRNWREDRIYQIGDTTYPGTTIARIPDLETMIVEAMLFDVDDGRIAAGQRVTATLDAFPATTYSGEVREIAAFAKEAGPMSLRRCTRTLIDLDDLDTERLLPGMSVKVVVHGVTLESELLVPRASVRWYDVGPRLVLVSGAEAEVEVLSCNSHSCAIRGDVEGAPLAVALRGAQG